MKIEIIMGDGSPTPTEVQSAVLNRIAALAAAEPTNDGICPLCGSTILLGRMRHHKTWCNTEAAR